MCGIFAAVSLAEPFNSKEYNLFRSITDLVTYRGPDASDYRTYNFQGKNSKEYFKIFFGHRRLSIIDLSHDGTQPMESNNNHIIFNGEIFNYLELRQELKTYGIQFKTNTDTEVILKVYEVFGSKGFDKLNGMWAFIILDLNNKVIVVSRDRFAIKPLYWFKNSERIFFGSEIKQLLQLQKSRTLNIKSISRLFYQGILDMDTDTFFEGIESTEAKHNLIIDLHSGEIKKEKYWDYKFNEISGSDVFDKFRYLFEDSVKIRLRSDVEIGTLLSGGLDSSAISVVGKKLTGNNFKTYSVVSDNRKFSEESFIDLLINEKKILNEKLFINSSDVLKNFEIVINQQDDPFLNFIVVAHYTILQKIKNETDITVVLNGQGGDEVLAGYLRFFFFNLKILINSGKYLAVLKEMIGSLINRTVLMQWQISAAKRYLPTLRRKESNFILLDEQPENIENFKSLAESQIACIDKFTVPTINRYEDRNSMAHSLEIRLPFLDHRLVEFLINIESSCKIKNGWNKYILRKSMHDLPSKIRWRKDKKGFILPEEVWLKNDFKDDIISSFKKSRLEEFGIINGKSFLNNYYSFLNGNKHIHNLEVSRVYIAEKWIRQFFS